MPSIARRFWSKVFMGTAEECWIWKTNRCKPRRYASYAKFNMDGKSESAARVAYALHYGSFDKTLHVLHHCDNVRCVNPKHLFLGTHGDNMRDLVQKGRHGAKRHPEAIPRGIHHPMAKLNEIAILEIRRLYTGLRGEQQQLAKQFGVTQGMISAIVTRKNWTHIWRRWFYWMKNSC